MWLYFKEGEDMNKEENKEETWGYLYAKGVDYYYNRRNKQKLWDYLCTLNEEECGLRDAELREVFQLILRDYEGIL